LAEGTSETPGQPLEGGDEFYSSFPVVETTAATPPPGRTPSHIVVWIGIVALLAAGLVGAVVVASGSGGSGSPEAAVRKMMNAVADEDVLGTLDSLAPSERESMVKGIQDLFDQGKRLNALSPTADLNKITGIDLKIDNLALASETVGDNVAYVRLTGGTVTYDADLAKLPVGSLFADLIPKTDTTRHGSDPAVDPKDKTAGIATVKEGGHWYVSLWYSVAEQARRDAHESAPAFGQGVQARGADTPEAAVKTLLDSLTQLDVRRMIELTPPDEARALHDYAPLFIDKAESDVADMKAANSFPRITIDNLNLRAETSGGVSVVRLSGFLMRATLDGNPFSLEWDGSCVAVDATNYHHKTCAQDLPKQLPIFSGATYDGGFVTVRRDGQWYVSPTRTMFSVIVGTLKQIDPQGLKDLKDKGAAGFFDSLNGGLTGNSCVCTGLATNA
jgi:hypothetical protein